MRTLLFIICLIGVPVFSLPAVAAVEDEIIVVGSRIPEQGAGSVETLPREHLAKYAAAPLTAVLADSASLYLDANAGAGSLNSLYLRGADPNLTQVRIDGVAVNDPTNSRGGAYDIGGLPPALIERVEILPGAASAQYGSQALAGVVNIVTRDSVEHDSVSMAADGRGGRYGDYLAGGGDWLVAGAWREAGEQVAGSDYRGASMIAKKRFDIGPADRLTLGGRFEEADTRAFPDDSGGSLYAVSDELEHRDLDQAHLDLAYEHVLANGGWLKTRGDYYRHRADIETPAVAPGVRDPAGLPAAVADNLYRRRQFELHYLSPETARSRVVVGIDWLKETGSNEGFLDFGAFRAPASFELERETTGLFGEWLWQLADDITVTLGERLDVIDGQTGDTDSEQTSRLGLKWRSPDDAHLLHGYGGEGYKPPSFYALGNPLVGNPDLKPESSLTREVGYRYQQKRLELGLVLFRNDFDDLIDFDPGPPPRLVNRDRVVIDGFELRLRHTPVESFSWQVHLSRAEAEIEGTRDELHDRPERRAGLIVEWRPAARWQVFLRNRYIGERLDSSIPTGDRELPSYVRSDVSVRWNSGDHWRLTVAVDNLSDKQYQASLGNPVAGRTYRLAVRYRFD